LQISIERFADIKKGYADESNNVSGVMKTKLHSFEKVSPHKTAVHSGENWSSFGGNWSLLGRKLYRTAH